MQYYVYNMIKRLLTYDIMSTRGSWEVTALHPSVLFIVYRLSQEIFFRMVQCFERRCKDLIILTSRVPNPLRDLGIGPSDETV
jgi:hypothetical protein